jgi:hypothetical protein
MSKNAHLLGPLGALFALAVSLSPASAGAAQDDDTIARLNDAGHALKLNVVPQGKTARYGRAISMINAPQDAVRKVLSQYAQYKDLAPDKFTNVRVVGKDHAGTEVYMQVPVMHGLMRMWMVLKFGQPQQIAPGVEVLEGKLVKGNVKDANIVFTTKRLDDNFTMLTCDLLITPDMPAPQSSIDEETRDSALKAVDAIHNKAQGHNRTFAFNGSVAQADAK